MGDMKVSETFEESIFIISNATLLGVAGLTPTCHAVRMSNGARTALTVVDVGSGWYKVTDFTEAAAGAYGTEWYVAGNYTIYGRAKTFKVGGGRVEDIYDGVVIIDGFHDVPAQDSTDDAQMRDVIGKKDDTAYYTSAVNKSITAYVKALINRVLVATADTADNVSIKDLVGNKSDTATFSLSNVASIMRYIKAMITVMWGGAGFVATASTVNTITAAALEDVVDKYVGRIVTPIAGNMAGEGRIISAYDGTQMLTVHTAWPEAPGNVAFVVTSEPVGDLFYGAKGLEDVVVFAGFNLNEVISYIGRAGSADVHNYHFAFLTCQLI